MEQLADELNLRGMMYRREQYTSELRGVQHQVAATLALQPVHEALDMVLLLVG